MHHPFDHHLVNPNLMIFSLGALVQVALEEHQWRTNSEGGLVFVTQFDLEEKTFDVSYVFGRQSISVISTSLTPTRMAQRDGGKNSRK